MKNCRCLALVIILGSLIPTVVRSDIPAFFDELYREHWLEYSRQRSRRFSQFCERFGVDSQNERNQHIYSRVYFYHDLFTGAGATNCARGGILKIPYFWHWETPNRRHAIISMPDSVLLTTVRPPMEYARYQTFADIDRVPALYLSDLMSDEPAYFHPDCGSFYTFGWCSEREMAYLLLFLLMGYDGKIVQDGIHTWSELWCRFVNAEGVEVNIAASVDNTFDTVEWQAVAAGLRAEQWRGDIGQGTEISWYNAKARSRSQRESLEQTPVSDKAALRINQKVSTALGRNQ